jgi:NADH dehydrogenase
MYQVASARLEPSSIAFPLRKVFQRAGNVRIRIAEVLSVDPAERSIKTNIGDFVYDYLVMAQGCKTNYFGNESLEKCAFPMKSIPEALQLRNRILQTFEDALDVEAGQLQFYLNFVIVGGGPTGVELAGALAEMKTHVLPKDYPDKDFSKLTIYVIESAPNVLNVMSDDAKKSARRYLEQMGVIVMTDAYVESYDGTTVKLRGGDEIQARNVIWAAGITGSTIDGLPAEAYVRGGRIRTNRYSESELVKNVYAIGDIAYMETPKYPKGHPQLAAVAIEQAKVLAKNFKKMAQGQSLKPYEYHNKGTMATVGKRKAVVDLPKFSFHGRLAWLTWMFVHLMLILSVKNKIIIFITWVYSYFNNDSTLRVLIRPVTKKVKN